MQWLTAVLGSVVARMLTFSMMFFAYVFAKRVAIVTGFIVASAMLFVSMAAAIKGLVMAMRVTMPPLLVQFTYFLPADINLFLASLVTVRLTHFVWRWTQANLGAYANIGGSGEGKYF